MSKYRFVVGSDSDEGPERNYSPEPGFPHQWSPPPPDPSLSELLEISSACYFEI